MSETILQIRDLDISFRTNAGCVHAIRGVNFELRRGETVAIVGESGSGKSVTMKAAMGLLDSNATVNHGEIIYAYPDGHGGTHPVDLLKLTRKQLRQTINGQHIAMVFQDPMTSLDPTMQIGKQVMEGMILHCGMSKQQAHDRALELLQLVGITDAEKRMKNYPHQLSGGMRQRVVIAIAMACNPKILICDEPTTALDVTIQAQILNLIRELQKKYQLTTIYITHDLGVVANVADRIAVMYAGDIVEIGTCNEVFYAPQHPYTWALLSSLPQLGIKGEDLYSIKGTPPNLFNKVRGDAFAPRNPHALKIDFLHRPPYFEVSPTHKARTWLLDPRSPKVEPPEHIKNIRNIRANMDQKEGGAQ